MKLDLKGQADWMDRADRFAMLHARKHGKPAHAAMFEDLEKAKRRKYVLTRPEDETQDEPLELTLLQARCFLSYVEAVLRYDGSHPLRDREGRLCGLWRQLGIGQGEGEEAAA